MKYSILIVLVALMAIGLSEAFFNRGRASESHEGESHEDSDSRGGDSRAASSQESRSREGQDQSKEGGMMGGLFGWLKGSSEEERRGSDSEESSEEGRGGSREGQGSREGEQRNRLNPCRLENAMGTTIDAMNCTANATCTGQRVRVNNTAGAVFFVTFCPVTEMPAMPEDDSEEDDMGDMDDMAADSDSSESDSDSSESEEEEMMSPISIFLHSIDNRCAPVPTMYESEEENDDDDSMVKRSAEGRGGRGRSSSSEEDSSEERIAAPTTCQRNATCSGLMSNDFDGQMLSICLPNNRNLTFRYLLRCHERDMERSRERSRSEESSEEEHWFLKAFKDFMEKLHEKARGGRGGSSSEESEERGGASSRGEGESDEMGGASSQEGGEGGRSRQRRDGHEGSEEGSDEGSMQQRSGERSGEQYSYGCPN